MSSLHWPHADDGTANDCAIVIAATTNAPLRHAQEPSFRSRSDLVIVPTTVTDRTGKFVRGLTAADFDLLEDDTPRPIAQFSESRVPVSVAILLDVSGSMSKEPNRWQLTRRAIASFLSRLEPQDEVTVIVFNDRSERLGGWTRHTLDVFSALARVKTGGSTALFRALQTTMPVLREAAHSRRVLLLISDGNDNEADGLDGTSRRVAARVRAGDAIRRSGIALYAIGIGMGREPVNRRLLGDLTEPTGAYFEVVSNSAMLETAVGRVADDLRDQYVLAFEPTKTDGEFHRIQVRARGEHRVRARHGYVAAPLGR
jgi:Ca-activated chloride channel homolog